MSRRLYIFDDRTARGWEPFSLTRPAGELLFGVLLLRERIERAVGSPAHAYLRTGELRDFEEEGAPPVWESERLDRGVERILLSSRYLPPLPFRGGDSGEGILPRALPGGSPSGGTRLLVGGEPVGWLLPVGAPTPSEAQLLGGGRDPDPPGTNPDRRAEIPETPALEIPGAVLATLWELLDRQPAQLLEDLLGLHAVGGPHVQPLGELPGVHSVGDHPVTAGQGAQVDPGVVLDTREGPIHLGQGVHIRPFTHLRGPASIGSSSILLGGSFETVACGPVCKLRGEISGSIILGYSNKAHDGFLGHSILGRWVNLGAYTTNSDLKNNYGTMRVGTGAGEVETGLLKVGAFLGDHVKTGIGTLVNGGTCVGAGTNLFGSLPPPKWVPPFQWGGGDSFQPYRLGAFLATAEAAMARRGVLLSARYRSFLTRAWERVQPRSETDTVRPPRGRAGAE